MLTGLSGSLRNNSLRMRTYILHACALWLRMKTKPLLAYIQYLTYTTINAFRATPTIILKSCHNENPHSNKGSLCHTAR